MIKFTSEHGKVFCDAETRGFCVYLDTWAILKLAKDPEHRGQEFVNSIRQGNTLLFSWANAIEICDLSGASSDAVCLFLNGLGPHWLPLELNPWKVVEKERVGPLQKAPVPESFMEGYCKERFFDVSTKGDNPFKLSESFFQLGEVLNWLKNNKEMLKTNKERIDNALEGLIKQMRVEYDKDRASFDRTYPENPYNPRLPTTFVINNLMRTLVRKAKEFCFKPGDGLDFSHAVLAAAFGSIVTLDKQWKDRIEGLPTPNHLAKVFYEGEFNEFVELLKDLANSRSASSG